MKSFIAKLMYKILYKIDNISTYEYESASYCGHHYNGHNGKYTISSYHEGIGYCEAKLGCIYVHKNSEEVKWDMWIKLFKHPPIIYHKLIKGIKPKYDLIMCIHYDGFIGFRNGFIDKWFDGFIPFRNGKTAWHFLGFRFIKRIIYENAQGITPNQISLIKKYKTKN